MTANVNDKYTVVIGLEVHAQLQTQSKIYNSDSAAYGGSPNSHVSVITLAHPGTLPRLNRKAAEFAIKMGLACNSGISRYQIFDRKNYFYPDLPKGYQLTQDRTPICKGGFITITTKAGERSIPLNRIHIEEDAGKSIHLDNEPDTLIDFNRAGVPLIEIVTEPALRSSEEAAALMTEIRRLVRYLEICDGNMEEGSLRCDANVSLMLKDAKEYGKKVEIKNMNSMRHVQRAVDYEVERQTAILEKGEQVISETRTFDANTGETYGMRTKEELNDYRYFPDPDLSPLEVSEEWLNSIKASMPELPRELKEKLVSKYKLPEYDAKVLTQSKELAQYFEAAGSFTSNFKAVSNWLMGPVKSYLNEKGIEADQLPVAPQVLAQVIELVDSGKISFAAASQKLFPELILSPHIKPAELAQELNLVQDSDPDSLLPVVEQIMKEFPLKVEEYRNGRKAILTMFMGEAMKRTKGKADPKRVNELFLQKLS
ncbi:MAG: Asp-tRNA(Asn)/Glu-tRNA(Gln) amidotransferase subunit GatB [Cyclobacteriaceae bacterium]|nr:Asp-tRNA(Asn)/Glu-tRNA(Gln) amidotransferase subunit GatB [Cyclobacteriaceae bacterium]